MAIVKLQGDADRLRGVYYQFNSDDQPIGIGGMGKVFRGLCVDEYNRTTRPVAIKFMYDDLPLNAYERARRESEIQLRHDNLVEMLGFIETQDRTPKGDICTHYHVVSELLAGVSLSDLLQGRTTDHNGVEYPFAVTMLQFYRNDSEHFAQTVVLSVLSGVMALHDAGYIHRDIDPSNIMLTADGHIKLIDFGIAKQMKTLTTGDKSFTVAGKFMGKPEYAAPELVLGDVDYQNQTTDVYAIGILLFQCIVGHIPFEGARHEILEKQLRERIPLEGIDNKALRNVVATACAKKQEHRYQTAAQMRSALENINKPQNSSSLSKIVYIFVALAILVLSFMLTFLILNKSQHSSEEMAKMNLEETAVKDKEFLSRIAQMLSTADSLSQLGLSRKDEDNYEKQMMEACVYYAKVEEIVKDNPSVGYSVNDIKSKRRGVLEQLGITITDLSNVAQELENLEQYDVAEVFRERVKTVREFKEKWDE